MKCILEKRINFIVSEVIFYTALYYYFWISIPLLRNVNAIKRR